MYKCIYMQITVSILDRNKQGHSRSLVKSNNVNRLPITHIWLQILSTITMFRYVLSPLPFVIYRDSTAVTNSVV